MSHVKVTLINTDNLVDTEPEIIELEDDTLGAAQEAAGAYAARVSRETGVGHLVSGLHWSAEGVDAVDTTADAVSEAEPWRDLS